MDGSERKRLIGILLLVGGIVLGWWLKGHLQRPIRQMSQTEDQAAQKWLGTWVGGEMEFDITQDPANGTYQLQNRTFNFTCDVTLNGDHAHWHGPPGSWVMDLTLAGDGKTAKGQGTDDQGQGLHKDFEFQKLSQRP